MTNFKADPGGIFESDSHRRVLAHLPLPADEPVDMTALGFRVSEDPHHGMQSMDDLRKVLTDLKGEGYVSKTGLKMTKKGLDALEADVPADTPQTPGPVLLEGLETRGNGGLGGTVKT